MNQQTSIVEVIKARLAEGSLSIPVFHVVAIRLQQALARPDFDIKEVHQLLNADPGIATGVLRAANSAFYAGLTKVSTIREAIIRLGANEVANLAMVTTQQDLYRSNDTRYNAVMQTLWKHSFCCAVGSKWLAQKVGFAAQAQEAFLGGLLHDLGKLFLLKCMEEVGREQHFNGVTSQAVLREVLSTLHVEQGYQLMVQWQMPQIYCDIVAGHQQERWDQGNVLLAMVRLANLACRKLGIGMNRDPSVLLFASGEAQVLGLKETALAELEIVIEDALAVPISAE
ncbi:HDOD domain-containing protein [Geomonas sp. Red69]|uniref:HDOD domain-containing protein n=1 Tax=Geomonas diazotrophica TaxID=2843197 RepID=A0ABX8JJ39_9BACT|nr:MULTISPECIES: HDOD domain-containing protein [Geomonas]MBU5635430.1 HDOD domain-containing protein [Geomonas diazotrophica]QWV97517.1 HDOD domain-containing protein [Geomonas nitrogeniifigens]QXE86657.1 HDOD domain-containing protein [Geomonas nitrogeniifigens]